MRISFNILVLFLGFIEYGNGEKIEGLMFNSIYDGPLNHNNATSLKIPADKTISFEKNIRLEFDIFFWRKSPFGFILSAGNDEDPNLFVLSYSDYKSKDTSYIELTYMDRPSIISVPIKDQDQGWDKWNHLALYFELKNQRIGLSFQEQDIIWYKDKIPMSNQMQFDFGATNFVVEPPRMALKNITISLDNDLTIDWPLDEQEGNVAYSNKDNFSSWDGDVTDGVWIKSLHNTLRPVFNQRIYENDFQFLGVDNERNQFIYNLNDTLFYFDHGRGRISKQYPFPITSEDNFIYKYHPVKKKIFTTHGGGGGPISFFNESTNSWENNIQDYESDGLYYTSNFLYNYDTKDIYTLGGYGWYEQKNTLQLYNFQNTRWDPLQYQTNKGKLFFPRCKANVKYDKALDKYFIYGGQGNESGKQQQGFRELNDFWILDMNTLELNQIWEDSSQAYEDGDKYQKVAISGKHKTIFKILGNEISNHNNMLNLNGNLKIEYSSFHSRKFTPITIATNFDVKTNISLVHFEALDYNNELLIVYLKDDLEEKTINFSTVRIPIIAPIQEKESYAEIVLIFLGIILISGFVITTSVKDRNNDAAPKQNLPTPYKDKNKSSKGLHIRLLNQFEIIMDGQQIKNESWKSKKAKELLVYILLKGERGALTNEVHSIFWPDVNLESARNSRSVALSRIRNVLSVYKELLVLDDDKIKIENHEDLSLDYNQLLHLLSNSTQKSDDHMEIINLFGKGELVPSIKSDWIIPFRQDLLNRVTKYVKSKANNYIDKKDWKKVKNMGIHLLNWDKFNDDGMRLAVLGNEMLNNTATAHKIYSNFIEGYKSEIGEEYPISYKNIVSNQFKGVL